MREITAETWVRTLVMAFALLNQLLTMSGKNPLPFSDEEAYTALTALLTVGASLWAWWKNNSFTSAAIAADDYKQALNQEGGNRDE